MNDRELVGGIIERRPEAVEYLLASYHGKARALIFSIVKELNDVEDVLQNLWMSVVRNAHRFKFESKFETWLYRVATNEALMFLRKKKQRHLEDLCFDMTHCEKVIASDARLTDHFALRTLAEASAHISESSRTYVWMSVGGLENREIARQKKITLPAAKSRLHRGRVELRQWAFSLFEEFEEAA